MESWIFRNRSRLLAIYDGAPSAPAPPAALPVPAAPSTLRVLPSEACGAEDRLLQLELLPPPRRPLPPGRARAGEG